MATGTAVSMMHGPAADRLRRMATYASVAVAAVLIAVKFAAWLETGSVALLSSLVDSLLDIVASLVNLVAVRHAMSPADREHRFGHGKAEPLALGRGGARRDDIEVGWVDQSEPRKSG